MISGGAVWLVVRVYFVVAINTCNTLQEQYSRRNCLLLHGMPESEEDSNEAVISVCNGKLELNISADDIERSHLLGSSRHSKDHATRNDILDYIVDFSSSTMAFNVAKIASARASLTISLTKSLRVAGP